MAITTVTVTATFTRPDGEPDDGRVTATLSGAIENGTQIVEPEPITGILVAGVLKDASGLSPFTLIANDDPGTTPAGSSYEFLIDVDSAAPQRFSAVISHTAGTVDLSVLTP